MSGLPADKAGTEKTEYDETNWPCILYVRMIEIYLYTSIAPVPLATMTNREWGQIGNNYASSEAKDSSTEIVTLTLIDDDSESGGDASREEE